MLLHVRVWSAVFRASLRHMAGRRSNAPDCLESVEDTKSPSPEHHASLIELQDEIRRCLTQLPAKQAMAFTLVKIQDLSYAECADAMKCTQEAARFLVHRAVRSLAGLLRKRAPGG